MLCSLFGTVPLLHPEARTLIETNPSLFILADECQNLVSKPKIHPTPNQAVILSFNDKTCPGHMGGALLLAPGSGLAISFARSSLSNRILCSLGLWKLFYSSVIDHLCMRIRSLIGKSPHFAIPTLPEYSSCTRPHYDCEAEPIYALSAAKALYSLKHLPRYETSRSKNFRFLTDNGLISGHNPAHSDDPPPPFVPSDGPRESLPFPLKAPYACEPGSSKRPQAYAIKINKSYIPHKT